MIKLVTRIFKISDTGENAENAIKVLVTRKKGLRRLHRAKTWKMRKTRTRKRGKFSKGFLQSEILGEVSFGRGAVWGEVFDEVWCEV